MRKKKQKINVSDHGEADSVVSYYFSIDK